MLAYSDIQVSLWRQEMLHLMVLCKFSAETVSAMEPRVTNTPEKWLSMIVWTLCLVPNALHMFVYKQNSWNAEPPIFCKAGQVLWSWTVQNSLMIWMLIYSFCKFVRRIWRIQRPGIILTLSLIMLTFLNLIQQRNSLKMWPQCAHQPEYTLPRPPKVYQKPLKYGCIHI